MISLWTIEQRRDDLMMAAPEKLREPNLDYYRGSLYRWTEVAIRMAAQRAPQFLQGELAETRTPSQRFDETLHPYCMPLNFQNTNASSFTP
jgi:hypothetical protein